MAKQYNFKVKNKLALNQIMAYISLGVGILSLVFLWAPGIVVKSSIYQNTENISMWSTIWGTGFSITPGLVVAFFFTITASLVALGAVSFRFAGLLSFLLFIAAGVLYFCAVPLIGNVNVRGTIAGLGYGTYIVGILNFIAAVLSFLATRGD